MTLLEETPDTTVLYSVFRRELEIQKEPLKVHVARINRKMRKLLHSEVSPIVNVRNVGYLLDNGQNLVIPRH